MSSRIEEVFQAVRSEGRMAFMPFITAGDPDMQATQKLIRKLGEANVDLIEVGFPYSDPIADGPVIQASYTRALERKLHVKDIFAAIKELKGESVPPLVAMVSFAIIFRTGVETFLEHCVDSGISGLIVPDLPGAEAEELFEATKSHGLNLVQLIAPTTPRQRVRQILASCSGFVYCIAVAGTTGERESVATALLDQLRWLKEETELPLAVGFGISRPEHVAPLRGLADGVIVGSAIVRKLEGMGEGESRGGLEAVLEDVGSFAGEMVSAVQVPKS